VLVAIAMIAGIGEAAAQTASRMPSALAQHLATGFPLTGAHESARAKTVTLGHPERHAQACAVCHGTGSRINAVTINVALPGDATCSVCHTTVSFTGTLITRACCRVRARRAITAQRRAVPLAHIATVESCDSCHRTVVWAGATFDHSRIRAVPAQRATTGRRPPAGRSITW
jgi:hypothetical protein